MLIVDTHGSNDGQDCFVVIDDNLGVHNGDDLFSLLDKGVVDLVVFHHLAGDDRHDLLPFYELDNILDEVRLIDHIITQKLIDS